MFGAFSPSSTCLIVLFCAITMPAAAFGDERTDAGPNRLPLQESAQQASLDKTNDDIAWDGDNDSAMIFPHINYVTLSCVEAFEPLNEFIWPLNDAVSQHTDNSGFDIVQLDHVPHDRSYVCHDLHVSVCAACVCEMTEANVNRCEFAVDGTSQVRDLRFKNILSTRRSDPAEGIEALNNQAALAAAPATGYAENFAAVSVNPHVVNPLVVTPYLCADALPVAYQNSTNANERRAGFVARPLSQIHLGDAMSPQSADGEPLKLPETTRQKKGVSVSKEEHFTAGPWQPSHPPRNTFSFRHQPLYFEDPNLERCGQTYGCFTEAVNVIHFGGRIPMIAYLMGSNSPHSCVPALADCPSCTTFGMDAYLPRPTVKALAAQAAASTGLIFVIP